MRTVLPALAERCEIRIGELVSYDGSQAYIDHLRAACEGADVVHVEHNHAYFKRGRTKDVFNSIFRDVTAPIVLSVNEVPESGQRIWPPRSAVRRLITGKNMSRTLKRVQTVYAYSSHQARSSARLGAADEHVIYYPHYVPEPIPVDDLENGSWRSNHGVPVDARVMLVFGFVSRRKRIELAVQALAKMPEDTFLVIGGSPVYESDKLYLDSVMDTVRTLGLENRVIVTGYLSDTNLASVMNQSDLVLFPPSAAYSSGSLARAISFRRPILASSTPTVDEITQVEPCMATFISDDVNDLAKQATKLLDSPEMRNHLSDACSRYAEQFSIAARADHYVKTYRRLSGDDAVSGQGMTVVPYTTLTGGSGT